MALSWLGGALHSSPPPTDPSPILLTSATTVEWRFLGHHAGGDEDARSMPSFKESKFLCFSAGVLSCFELIPQ